MTWTLHMLKRKYLQGFIFAAFLYTSKLQTHGKGLDVVNVWGFVTILASYM